METKKNAPRERGAWSVLQVHCCMDLRTSGPRAKEHGEVFAIHAAITVDIAWYVGVTAVVNVIFTAVNDDSPHMIASSADCAVFKGDDGWVGSPLEWVPVRVTVHVQTTPVITESASAMGGTPRNHVNRVVTSAIGEAAVRENRRASTVRPR